MSLFIFFSICETYCTLSEKLFSLFSLPQNLRRLDRIFPRSTKPAPLFQGFAGERLNLPLSPLPLCSLTSTPKPRAEGSSPSAPAKNREASTMLASLFFVSAHKDSATRHGCALRSACRGVSERQWRSAANRPRRQPRPSPSAPAKKVRYRLCGT